MVSQNAFDYTLRWWPDQKPELLSLTLGGPEVRYLRAGQGPVLVLLHSIRTQLDLFQRVIPKLTDHFAVYAFDYPGWLVGNRSGRRLSRTGDARACR
jgi:hypothetical protein